MFKVQSHATRTLSWWHKQSAKIDFNPTYQRKGNLWGDRDKAFLIDSILNEFDLPKIYIADFTILNTALNTKNLPYAVIDGRQRLESIFQFFDDELRLNGDFKLFTRPDLDLGGMKYSELRSKHPEISEIFEEFNLDVMSVITDDAEKIKDLFVRLNKSKALTGAELRNAMAGIVPDLIRNLADRSFFKEITRFSIERGQDYNAAAKFLIIEFKGDFVDLKKKNLDQFVKDGAQTDDPEPYYDAAYRAKEVIEKLAVAFQRKDTLLSSQGLLPLIYQLAKREISAPELRAYFSDLDARRKDNQKTVKLDAPSADPALLAFESNVRNVNDQGSLTAAFAFLIQDAELFFGRSI
ncbi:MAG TPA: DUF262 domain-containing protein [Arenimonas sp.]|mgnify:CR=1 FL=1|nr:DUF262 domain-containing protein [Burkholderiales bacterium]HOZ06351.1 DUF262 domain-containing protein [Arenimonas sp.]